MIPVGPGGKDLSARKRMMLADVLTLFIEWKRKEMAARRAMMQNPPPPSDQDIARAFAACLWNAIDERQEYEEAIMDFFKPPPEPGEETPK